MLPTMVPIVGAGHRHSTFYNTEHRLLGWTLSAATAEGDAELVKSA
jgi:D-amino-acid dehydrogenase